MRPTVREVSKQYTGRVTLVVVDMYSQSGEHQAQGLKVRGHPVLLFHDQAGRERLRRYGLLDKDQIQQGFALLANAP